MRALRPRSPSATTTALMKGNRGGPGNILSGLLALPRARPQSLARDQAGAALKRPVGPRPLAHHRQPVPESDQPEDVDEQPDQPRDETRQLPRGDIRDG